MPLASLLGTLFGPVGRVVLALLAFSVWTTYQRLDAAHEAEIACQQAHESAAVAELQRQLEVARIVEQNAKARADRAEAEMTKIRGVADELSKLVAKAPASDCDIPPDIRERLQSIH